MVVGVDGSGPKLQTDSPLARTAWGSVCVCVCALYRSTRALSLSLSLSLLQTAAAASFAASILFHCVCKRPPLLTDIHTQTHSQTDILYTGGWLGGWEAGREAGGENTSLLCNTSNGHSPSRTQHFTLTLLGCIAQKWRSCVFFSLFFPSNLLQFQSEADIWWQGCLSLRDHYSKSSPFASLGSCCKTQKSQFSPRETCTYIISHPLSSSFLFSAPGDITRRAVRSLQ